MARQAVIRKTHQEIHNKGSRLRDFILGWQDGLVNVLGVMLGLISVTNDVKIILIAALSAACAESISMAAVAYTSFKAEKDYYMSEVAREKSEMERVPDVERNEIRVIYRQIGFSGILLNSIVRHITSDKKRWLDVMMEQELRIFPSDITPSNIAMVVGISAFIGSLMPIIPFIFFPISSAMWIALIFSTIILFGIGIYKAITTIGNPLRSGLEMAFIGMAAASAGYGVGAILGAAIR
jgi:VIT1/CCC1 family predicted Fe2+/Mn2+ transporter